MAVGRDGVGATLVDGANVSGPAHVIGAVGFVGLDQTGRHGIPLASLASWRFVSCG